MLLTEIHRELDTVLDELIDNEQIVAIFQNESEWGPRALGNRSIMFDPRHPNAKNIVNTVKMREAYRPFACTVMLEHAEEYFDMLQLPESPWMSFAIQCKPKALKDIPTLVHADNTCRIQTVDDGFLSLLLEEYYKISGVPVLLNTSFNDSGKPIVETPQDAIDAFLNMNIDYLVMNNTIIGK